MNLILLFEDDYIDTNTVSLSGRRLKHIRTVHKVTDGKSLSVGTINGLIGTGIVKSVTKERVLMKTDLSVSPPKPLPLKLVLAMPRPKVFSRILACVTAMGVKEIYLIHAQKVEKSYWQSPRLDSENIRKQLILGLEQAKDTVMPEISFHRLFKPFVEDVLPGICENSLKLVAHPYCKKSLPVGINKPATLVVGPEGGFIPYEIEKLENTGFQAVHMGSRILTVETALPALLAKLY